MPVHVDVRRSRRLRTVRTGWNIRYKYDRAVGSAQARFDGLYQGFQRRKYESHTTSRATHYAVARKAVMQCWVLLAWPIL